jgi:transcriptional regulator with XRE-family HTH domain
MKKAIGERIRLLRLSKGLSQENMAIELNISTGAYSNIERGITDISVSRLYQIAIFFEIDVNDLLNDNGLKQITNEKGSLVNIANRMDILERELQSQKTEISYLKDIIQLISSNISGKK